MINRPIQVLVASLGLVAGCKRSSPDAVTPLLKAFEPQVAKRAPAGGGEAQVTGGITIADEQRNRELAESAVAAYKRNDLMTAGAALQKLRATRAMTDDQRMAAQDAMSDFQKAMAERAERGDAAAEEALDYLRGGHLRR